MNLSEYTQIKFCEEKPNISSTYRIRVVLREAISIPLLFTHYESTFKFLYGEMYLLDEYGSIANLEGSLTNSIANKSIKVILNIDTDIADFREWFNKNLLNRTVSLQMTNENSDTEIVHFMRATDFTKVYTNNRSSSKTIEISFNPTKINPEILRDNFNPIRDYITSPSSFLKNGTITKSLNVELLFQSFVNTQYIELRIGKTKNIKDSELIISNVLNLSDGQHFVFCVCKSKPSVYQLINILVDNNLASIITLH